MSTLSAEQVLHPIEPADVASPLVGRERLRRDLLLRGREAGLETRAFGVRCAAPREQRASLVRCQSPARQRPAVQILLQFVLRVLPPCLRHNRPRSLSLAGEQGRRHSCSGPRSSRRRDGSRAPSVAASLHRGPPQLPPLCCHICRGEHSPHPRPCSPNVLQRAPYARIPQPHAPPSRPIDAAEIPTGKPRESP